jgi:hypothetical protein
MPGTYLQVIYTSRILDIDGHFFFFPEEGGLV